MPEPNRKPDLSGFESSRSKTPPPEITTEEDNEKRLFQCRTIATKSGSCSQWTDEDGNKSTVSISSTSEYESTVETTSEGSGGGKNKITVVSDVKSVTDDTCKEISELPPPFMKATMVRRLTKFDVELIEHQDTENDHFCDEQMAHPWKGQEINRRTTVYHLKCKDRVIQSDDAASTNSATESKAPTASETCTTTPALRHIAPLLKPTPKLHASILTPLFLNGNPIQTARTHQVGHNRQPTYQVVSLESEQGASALYQLTSSLAAPKYCTISLCSSRVHWTDLLLLYNASVEQVVVLPRPSLQHVDSKMVDRKIHKVDLLMPPEGPLVALKLDPTWYSINYLLAHGKHIAVPYRIPHVPLHRARKIKAEIGKTQLVNAKILYREAKMEPIILLESFKANPIRLATVEERDPECVQHIRLCQEAIEWPKGLVMQPQTQVPVQEVKVKYEPTLPSSFPVQLQNQPQQQSQQVVSVKKETFSKNRDPYTEGAKPSDSRLSTAPCKGIAAPNAIVVRSNANEGGQKLIVDKDGRREDDDVCEALLPTRERIKHIKKTGGAIIEYPEEVRRYHSHYLLKKHSDKTIVQVTSMRSYVIGFILLLLAASIQAVNKNPSSFGPAILAPSDADDVNNSTAAEEGPAGNESGSKGDVPKNPSTPSEDDKGNATANNPNPTLGPNNSTTGGGSDVQRIGSEQPSTNASEPTQSPPPIDDGTTIDPGAASPSSVLISCALTLIVARFNTH